MVILKYRLCAALHHLSENDAGLSMEISKHRLSAILSMKISNNRLRAILHRLSEKCRFEHGKHRNIY